MGKVETHSNGLPFDKTQIRLLKSNLEKSDFVSLGDTLQKTGATKNTINYFTSLVIGDFLTHSERRGLVD